MAECLAAMVTPSQWTQLGRYATLRKKILTGSTLKSLVFLGTGAFSSISGEVVNPILISLAPSGPIARRLLGLDLSGQRSKAAAIRSSQLSYVSQLDMLANPDSRILLTRQATGPLLATFASSRYGLRTGDAARLIRKFWEQPTDDRWVFHQGPPDGSSPYTGRQNVLRWENGGGPLLELAASGIASIQGGDAWNRSGVVVSLMGDLPAAIYTGEKFDNNCAVLWANDAANAEALWAFLSRPAFGQAVRRLDRSIKVTNATLLKVPVEGFFSPDKPPSEVLRGLPKPKSDDPAQWLFEGVPALSTEPLHVSISRLLGYEWPGQERDLLTPLADDDGVVCVPPVGGEDAAPERIRELLAVSYGDDWGPGRLEQLPARVGVRTSNSELNKWVRVNFFKDHCRVFANRPFIWQIWDGTATGFSALVNYHRLDRRLLERITYDYLGNWWMSRLRDDIKTEKPGAEFLLAAAETLKQKLELILRGEPPYDIYVRWKALAEQPIGWDPDLDDGVRLNIRPFVTAGILRHKPNIKWERDRGKNPDGSERLNDLHFTLAEKWAARRGGPA